MDHAAVMFLHVSTSWRCDWLLDCHNWRPSMSTYQPCEGKVEVGANVIL